MPCSFECNSVSTMLRASLMRRGALQYLYLSRIRPPTSRSLEQTLGSEAVSRSRRRLPLWARLLRMVCMLRPQKGRCALRALC